jgi:hypothetical protein
MNDMDCHIDEYFDGLFLSNENIYRFVSNIDEFLEETTEIIDHE